MGLTAPAPHPTLSPIKPTGKCIPGTASEYSHGPKALDRMERDGPAERYSIREG